MRPWLRTFQYHAPFARVTVARRGDHPKDGSRIGFPHTGCPARPSGPAGRERGVRARDREPLVDEAEELGRTTAAAPGGAPLAGRLDQPVALEHALEVGRRD